MWRHHKRMLCEVLSPCRQCQQGCRNGSMLLPPARRKVTPPRTSEHLRPAPRGSERLGAAPRCPSQRHVPWRAVRVTETMPGGPTSRPVALWARPPVPCRPEDLRSWPGGALEEAGWALELSRVTRRGERATCLWYSSVGGSIGGGVGGESGLWGGGGGGVKEGKRGHCLF